MERELGPRTAHAVEQLFEFERRGTVWREKGIAPSAHKAVTDEETNIEANRARMTYDTLDTNPHRESDFEPMRLHLKFEVAADGDHMTGTARAGILPASKLKGKRVS